MDYFKEKYSKTSEKNTTLEQMKRQKVKNALSTLCDEYLVDAGQVLKFEVTPKDLPYLIVIIDEEPIKSMYDIIQVSETLFEASLKELDFF